MMNGLINSKININMKKPVLLFTFFFYLSNYSFAQQFGWVDYRSKISDFPGDTVLKNGSRSIADFQDVFFIDDNEGWVTTENGAEFDAVILHTIDGGETWEIQTPPSKCSSIWMLDKNTGYAGSFDGRIYKTTDGGQTWLYHSWANGPVRDIAFPPDEDIGYAVIDGSSFMYRIKPDALEAIQLNGPNFWSSISCPAIDKVWFVGGGTILFYDGNTLEYSSGVICGYFTSILFANASLGWTASDGCVGGYYAPKDSWVHLVDFEASQSGFDMCNVGEDHLWVVGINGLLMNTHNAKDFKRLDDGHAEVNVVWETPEHPLGNTLLSAVHATSVHNVFVVGVDKSIMKYTQVSGIGDEVEHLKFEIYPNPAVSVIGIQSAVFSRQSSNIEIYDLNGRKLIEKQIKSGSESIEIDVSILKNGVYFCRLIFENKSATQKLIIQK
jgi:photosystem II stability/assembly factor-like uncharacterized protein